jgi:hypothetical protein
MILPIEKVAEYRNLFVLWQLNCASVPLCENLFCTQRHGGTVWFTNLIMIYLFFTSPAEQENNDQ